jgi:hypothetical protein
VASGQSAFGRAEDLPKPTSESWGATFGFSDNFLVGGNGT